MTRSFAMILWACLLTFAACSGDKPKELLETAEFEERQMNLPHARQLYEDVIRLYPASKEADQARARLAALNSRTLKQSASSVLASLRDSTLSRSSSEVGSTVGAFPFAKIHTKGERPTRSAVCTSSPLRSLRPCGQPFEHPGFPYTPSFSAAC